MAIVRQTTIPLADYPSGSRQFTVNIPDSTREFYFEFARCTSVDPTIWPNDTTTLSVDFSMAINGGAFQFLVGFTAKGGIFSSKGVEASLTTWTKTIPNGVNRQMRMDVSIVGGPLRTTGSVELRD